MFKYSSDIFKISTEEIQKRILSGIPTLIPTGWTCFTNENPFDSHAVAALFKGNNLIICNRADFQQVTEYKFSPDLLTAEILTKILDSVRIYKETQFTNLLKELNCISGSVPIKPFPLQLIDNCAYASMELMVYTFLKKHGKIPLFEKWVHKARLLSVAKYLKNIIKCSYSVDYDFLRKIIYKSLSTKNLFDLIKPDNKKIMEADKYLKDIFKLEIGYPFLESYMSLLESTL